jgi:predicted negative regulator of RcsB-dependent stress response
MLQHVDDATYQPLIDGVKGDIYAAMGNASAAKQAYQTAQNETQAAKMMDPVLQMKVSQ